ncbi:Solitary outer membrane autotransporter beta-barrel domain [Vibrio neonatus]|uniref:Solitary outer membrane autotransporter beta-barrel domain n=1 Tax=Vibrio neonatus TaxID=278860 RepID=UPI0021C2E94C|nr:Solitary outer membrane autotransporter beta-barrel domain [Vibrio neonatus]
MKYGRCIPITISALACSEVALASLIDPDKYLSDIYSTTLVLTDSELITIGFGNFDPNKIFGTNNPDFGGQEAIDTRRRIAATSLPISFLFKDDNSLWLHRLKLRAAYLELSRDISYERFSGLQDWETDKNKDKVLAGYAEYSLGYQLSEQWQLFVGSGLHLMHYNNEFTANSPASDFIREEGIASVINGSSNAWVAEPQLDVIYTKALGGGELRFNSEYHYFWGRSFGGSIGTANATPEGWRIMNGLQYKYHLSPWGNRKQDLLFRARRIDVGGDLRDPLDTTHYGEYSVGWVIDTSDYSSLVYNVGIGLSLNYGSSLKGGALVFFYNE